METAMTAATRPMLETTTRMVLEGETRQMILVLSTDGENEQTRNGGKV
jgi:hypothetical protein